MKIELKKIKIKEVAEGYANDAEEGVVGYGGMLDIRPKYQREFIYQDKQRDEVIRTVKQGFPLNVMYWAKNSDKSFEVIDGQQRTISICEFVANNFSLDKRYFKNREKSEKEEILNYELMVYFCEGNDKEKLDWFQTINIAGEKLTNQELRNAVYSGPWVTDAKRHFSKAGCPAYQIANKYLAGKSIRQEHLETAISWLMDGEIEEYMAQNQHEPSASELWLYFQKVINWVEAIFPTYRKEMKGVDFGDLYNKFKGNKYDPKKLEKEITEFMQNEEITKKSGIYPYILTKEEKYLNIREFPDNHKREAYERQKGICPICKKKFNEEDMEADHITPWHKGGKTNLENCQMLCKADNRAKAGE